MQRWANALYWAMVGAICVPFLYLVVGGNPPLPAFLLASLLYMALILAGVWKVGLDGSWAFVVGFGLVPGIVLLKAILTDVALSNAPGCPAIDWGGSAGGFGSGEGSSSEEDATICAPVPAS